MSNIKQYFVSRWGENGYILEADYSQLEIVCLAVATGDPVLKADILSGKDLHRHFASKLFSKPEDQVTDAERRVAKSFSFMLQYGSGALHMAEQTGHSVETAKAFIEAYYSRYKVVKQCQDMWIDEVKRSRIPSVHKTPKGYPAGIGQYRDELGRIYTFVETDAPEWMGKTSTSFSPTKIKNFRIQGMATGGIVPMMVGKFVMRIYAKNLENSVLFVNTVHDSIVLDVQKPFLGTAAMLCKSELEKAPLYLKEHFGMYFDIPLKVEVKYGATWESSQQIKYEFGE